jgi:TPR repeat protein
MFHHLITSSSKSKPLTSVVGVSAISLILAGTSAKCSSDHDEEETRSFNDTLQLYKRQLPHYKEKWNWHNATSRIPTVSWPLDIPDDSDISSLQLDLSFCERREVSNDDNKRYCSNLQFRIASHLLLQPDLSTQQKGLKMVLSLAESGHPDSICAYATCLNDGRAGIESNPLAAVSWWKNASERYDHIQSTYELGVALYTGEGIAEDERLAVKYFRKSAESGHAGASYMLGDCLLDGVGVERDRGEALEWLVTAAELGHRGARSRVLAVLEKEEGVSYGYFTDASRQTLVDESSGKKRDSEEKLYSTRPVTLEHRFTIGGGARNPVVLARRQTIVNESRQKE